VVRLTVATRLRPVQLILISDPPTTHPRTAAVYSNYSESVDSKEVHSRKDAVLLAQIHSGHYHLFRAYQHLIDCTTDPTCQVCGEATHRPTCMMQHWLSDGPALSFTRMEILRRHDLSLDVLAAYPKQVIALAGRTLVHRVRSGVCVCVCVWCVVANNINATEIRPPRHDRALNVSRTGVATGAEVKSKWCLFCNYCKRLGSRLGKLSRCRRSS